MRHAKSPITEASWPQATPVANSLQPQPAGSAEQLALPALAPGTYYFAVRTADDNGNLGALSNLAVVCVRPWSIPPDDPDCHGFPTAIENHVGTDPNLACGLNAWPADINNDGFSDGSDIGALAGWFGQSVPPAPVRQDIAPEPPDNFVDGGDIGRMAALFGQTCVP